MKHSKYAAPFESYSMDRSDNSEESQSEEENANAIYHLLDGRQAEELRKKRKNERKNLKMGRHKMNRLELEENPYRYMDMHDLRLAPDPGLDGPIDIIPARYLKDLLMSLEEEEDDKPIPELSSHSNQHNKSRVEKNKPGIVIHKSIDEKRQERSQILEEKGPLHYTSEDIFKFSKYYKRNFGHYKQMKEAFLMWKTNSRQLKHFAIESDMKKKKKKIALQKKKIDNHEKKSKDLYYSTQDGPKDELVEDVPSVDLSKIIPNCNNVYRISKK